MASLLRRLQGKSASLDARLRKCALEVFRHLDVDGSGGLEPEEISDWLVSACGWTEMQVERRLWGHGGIWARLKSVEFEQFLKATIRFHWPVGDYDHEAEMRLVSQKVRFLKPLHVLRTFR